MDTETLVENQIDDGERFARLLAEMDFDVAACCWVKASEDGHWYLYVASKAVDEKGLAAAYRDAYGVLRSMEAAWVSMAEVKLISPHNPIARDVLEIQRRYPGRTPTRTQRPRLGNLSIEETYIYPPPATPLPLVVEKRRLKKDVAQIERPEHHLPTPAEKMAVGQIVSSGVNVQQAEEWVRKWRETQHPRPPIPKGTEVKAWVVTHWGNTPSADPNPLLMVEAPDGARGLVLKEDTEPV